MRGAASKGGMQCRGFALVYLLWVLALLAIASGSLAVGARVEMLEARNSLERARARLAARAGIVRLMQSPALPRGPSVSTEGNRSVLSWQFGGVDVRIEWNSAQGRVDLNRAGSSALRQAFAGAGVTDPDRRQALAAALLDWRDRDRATRLHGAEDDAYARSGMHYRPANRAFSDVRSVQRVHGIDESLYRRLRPLVTLHGSSRPDTRFAPPALAGEAVQQAPLSARPRLPPPWIVLSRARTRAGIEVALEAVLQPPGGSHPRWQVVMPPRSRWVPESQP